MTAPDDPLRKKGVVYLDPDLAAGPATHVLIIGVAAYQSPKFSKLLDTATISARIVADWFLSNEPQAFKNPECPLGSVAIALSETAGKDKAAYAGGDVPRAVFADTLQVVRSWVSRIDSHSENLAFIYVASHGESYLRRTAFLLEDYDTDEMDATAGMVEVEQFITSLENANPVRQLLIFDCCRTAMEDPLPWDETVGTKLISLKKSPSDHGMPREQWMICSTALDQVALGLRNGPTLFNLAMMDALKGVAGDPSLADWPVRPGVLVDRINDILKLHRLPEEEKPQIPSGRLAGSFNITLPGESNELPVYITLKDPSEWPGATLTISRKEAADITVKGLSNQSPFAFQRIPDNSEVRIVAENDGEALGSAQRKIRPPAAFIEISKAPPSIFTSVVAGLGAKPMGQLKLHVDGPIFASRAVSVEIVKRDAPEKEPERAIIDLRGGETTFEVEPADLTINIRTPDGLLQAHEVSVALDQVVTATFATPQSPHEWLGTASMSGAISGSNEVGRADLRPYPSNRVESDERADELETYSGSDDDAAEEGGDNAEGRSGRRRRSEPDGYDPEEAEAETYAEEFADPSDIVIHTIEPDPVFHYFEDGIEPGESGAAGLRKTQDDGRFIRLQFDDPIDIRFPKGSITREPFAVVNFNGRREVAVLPSLGRMGPPDRDGWIPHVVIDRLAPKSRSGITVLVDDSEWSGLLGYLAVRDMETSARLLNDGMKRTVLRAIEEKSNNPLAAAAGALVAVSTAKTDASSVWDPWLHNLANWFPGLPDGAVILARRLITQARSEKDIDEARMWFAEGLRRGVPYYSLSVDWLARGLESLPGDDADLLKMQRHARALANRVDSGLAFTVFRDGSWEDWDG